MMNRNVKLGMEERMKVLNSLLVEQGAEFTLVYTRVWKNNQNLEGYTMRSQDNNCSPTIYYDSEWFDKDDESVVAYLKTVYEKHSCQVDLSYVLNRDYILSHVKPRLVSENNLEELDKNGVAYVNMLDMAVLFYIPVEEIKDSIGSIQVKTSLLKETKLSLEEIYSAAVKNLEDDAEVKTIQEVLFADMGVSPELMGDDSYMWVGTTRNKIQGAAVMLCKSVREKLEEKIGCKVAILPSSVHEFIAVPYQSETQFKELRNLVREVNSTQVAIEDKLTDSVYIISNGELKLSA